MKNLAARNVISSHSISNCDPVREGQHVAAFCLSPAGDGLLYCATNAGHVICLSAAGSKVEWQAALLPPGDHPSSTSSSSCIAGLEYVLELDAVMVALASGDLLLIYTETKELEEVGSIEGGIACMAWSPDGELLALVSNSGNLLLMTKDWEALAEVPVWQAAAGATTTSTAPAAAAAAAAAAEPVAGEDHPQLLAAQVSWRGDGRFLATSCCYQGRAQQQVVVWDREGAACHARCSGEEAAALDGAICWPPNGRHLYAAAAAAAGAADVAAQEARGSSTSSAAGSQQPLPKPQQLQQQGVKPRVQLFERNGLPHGGFDVQPSSSSSSSDNAYAVAHMAFSPDSEVLAVVLAPASWHTGHWRHHTPGDPSHPSFDHSSDSWLVQLWHRSNWHWYQKQQLVCQAPGPAGLMVCWAEGPGLGLHVMSSRGEYQAFTFDWQASVSGRGTVAVVDGSQLLLTPLRLGLVPPPMAAVTASFPHPINLLAWLDGDIAADLYAPATGSTSNGQCNGAAAAALPPAEMLAALTADGHLHFLKAVESDLWEETLEEQSELGVPSSTLLPLGAAPAARAAAAGGSSTGGALAAAGFDDSQPPLADGRTVKTMVWLGPQQLLLVAAPFPDPADEQGAGDVLVTVHVDTPSDCQVSSAGDTSLLDCGRPACTQTSCSYAGAAVLAAVADPRGGALVQMVDGSLWAFAAGGTGLQPLPKGCHFPGPCPTLLPLPVHSLKGGDAVALGLTPSGLLWWGSTKLAWEVTSAAVRGGGPGGPALMYVTRHHLMFTVLLSELHTYKHQLPDAATGVHTWKRSEFPGELRAAMCAAMRPEALIAAARDVHLRAVEQGAVLLAAPWGTPSVVLQMQRGNLEGVAPRLLVLVAILVALDAGRYQEAWQLATRNRIDLNLLADYCWPRLVEQVASFVQAVPKQSDLCDLLFALKPGTVLGPQGLYSSLVPATNMPSSAYQAPDAAATTTTAAAAAGTAEGSDKVNRMCVALRQAVQQLPSSAEGAYLKVVVTSHARSQPPDLEAALLAIRDAKEGATTTTSSSSSSSSAAQPAAGASAAAAAASAAADGALKHLLLYVDADQLYQVALGLYDLSLAFMVISQAQKDPGEYLAELSAFNEHDENLRRAHIDRHLGRYPKALQHLVAAGPQHWEAALLLAQQQGLLRQLLHLLQQKGSSQEGQLGGQVDVQEWVRRTLAAYGVSLLQQRRAEDAAVAFTAAGDLESALGAYKEAGQWRMAMPLAGRLGWPIKQQQQLAVDLVDSLSASGQGADAAQLLLGVLGDVDGGVTALVAAKSWREGLRVSYQYGREDLVDTVVVPAAAQAAAALLRDAREATERIHKYLARLAEVRNKRHAMAAALAAADAEAAALGLEGGGVNPEEDMVSEAPSMVSGFSAYTDRTAATTATGMGSSTRAPSTVGAKKAMKAEKKAAKRGRIRQGSPAEEGALVSHLQGLGPAVHVLEEAGQLAELVCLQGHLEDAQKLQQAVAEWQQAHLTALQDIQQNPLPAEVAGAASAGGGPGGSKQQEQASGGAAAAAAAAAADVRWKWDVLRGG